MGNQTLIVIISSSHLIAGWSAFIAHLQMLPGRVACKAGSGAFKGYYVTESPVSQLGQGWQILLPEEQL